MGNLKKVVLSSDDRFTSAQKLYFVVIPNIRRNILGFNNFKAERKFSKLATYLALS